MAKLTVALLLTNFILVCSKLTPIPTPVSQIIIDNFLKTYYHESYTNVVIADRHNDLTPASEDLVFRTSASEVENFLDILEQIPRTFIIFVSSINSLTEIFGNISGSYMGLPGTSRYIIITAKMELTESISKTLWLFKLPFSFIVAYNQTADEAQLYNLNISNCGSNISVNFVSSLNKTSNLSSIRDWNFKSQFAGCPIYALWTIMPPYVNGINTSMQGIFVEFLNAMTSVGNRHIVYRPYDPIYLEELSEAYNFATLLEDFDGEFGQLFVGPINIHTSQIFDISPILIDNSLLFLVPRPFTSLQEKILRPGLLGLAFGYFSLIITVVILIYNMAKNTVDHTLFSSIVKTYLMFSGPILGIPSIHRLPKSRILQIYVGVFLLQSMTISTFIQGTIVSELSGTLYGKSIENNDELLNSNVPIKTIAGLAYLFRLGFRERDNEIYGRIEALEDALYPFEAGNIAVRKKNFATIVDKGYIIMRPNILKSFSVFEVYDMKQNLAMPKNSYFSSQYNEWIGHLLEIGILAKFTKLYQYFYSLKFYVEEDKRSFVVTLDQMLGGLLIAGAGYVFALLVFVIELAINTRKILRNLKPAKHTFSNEDSTNDLMK